MSEAEARELIAIVLSVSLGGATGIEVRSEGFRPFPRKAAAARVLGSGGRLFEARFPGWGTAFEPRTKAIQFVVDLQGDRDDTAQSVLRQSKCAVDINNDQKARAAVLGFGQPLDVEQFVELDRLSIDIASAHTLHDHFGSSAAVKEWLRAGLRLAGDPSLKRSTAIRTLQVHGLTVSVPFVLAPVEVTCVPAPTAGRPRWLDNEIRMLRTDAHQSHDIPSALNEFLRETHLADRCVVESGIWPPQPLAQAVLGWRNEALRHQRLGEDALPMPEEWRIILERRAIRVVEAFG